MTENQFDDQFRNRLGDYSSQVPEDMWERVRQKKDKNRKGFFFWLRYVILPGCLLVGLAAAYFMHSRPSATSQPSTLLRSSAPSQPSVLLRSSAPSQSPNAEPIPSTLAHPSASLPSPAPSQSPTPTPVSTPARSPIPSRPRPSRTASYSRDSIAQISDIAASTVDQPIIRRQPSSPSLPYADAPSATHRRPSSQSQVSADSRAKVPLSGLPGLQPIPHILGRVTAQIPLKKPAVSVKGSPVKKDSPVKTQSWYLDVYASPDWPFASQETPHQKMLFSYTAGIKLSRTFGRHFSGTIGLQYSELKSKISYSDSSVVPRIIHFSNSSIDIPLLIGYHITKNNFGAAVNTGIIFNAKTSGAPYKQHTGFSLYLGFDIAGKINDRMSLFAEPYFRYRLSNMVDDAYSFTSKVHVAGLSVGLRYNFKKSKKHK